MDLNTVKSETILLTSSHHLYPNIKTQTDAIRKKKQKKVSYGTQERSR